MMPTHSLIYNLSYLLPVWPLTSHVGPFAQLSSILGSMFRTALTVD